MIVNCYKSRFRNNDRWQQLKEEIQHNVCCLKTTVYQLSTSIGKIVVITQCYLSQDNHFGFRNCCKSRFLPKAGQTCQSIAHWVGNVELRSLYALISSEQQNINLNQLPVHDCMEEFKDRKAKAEVEAEQLSSSFALFISKLFVVLSVLLVTCETAASAFLFSISMSPKSTLWFGASFSKILIIYKNITLTVNVQKMNKMKSSVIDPLSTTMLHKLLLKGLCFVTNAFVHKGMLQGS